MLRAASSTRSAVAALGFKRLQTGTMAMELPRVFKGGLSVRAVARAVGYREASGLRQQFVRFYGHVPSMIQPEPPDYNGLWRKVEERAAD